MAFFVFLPCEPGPVTSDVGGRQEALDLVQASSGSGSSESAATQRRPTDGTIQALFPFRRLQAWFMDSRPSQISARESLSGRRLGLLLLALRNRLDVQTDSSLLAEFALLTLPSLGSATPPLRLSH